MAGRFREGEGGNGRGQGKVVDSFDTVSLRVQLAQVQGVDRAQQRLALGMG